MQATLQYAGYHAEGSFQLMRSTSSVPDPISAKFYPGVNLPQRGDIVLAFGSQFIRLADCRIVRSSPQRDANGGILYEYSFEDRRWRWQTKKLFAQWNVTIDGVQQYKKTFTEIVNYICRVILGEGTADTSVVQDSSYPENVTADGDLAVEVLESLLASRGYVVTLGLNDQMIIRRAGVGSNLPNDQFVMDGESSYSPHLIPRRLFILSAPIEFEKDLLLEPVGEDIDGTIKPINSLSYNPAGGWEKENPAKFGNVAKEQRDLAKRCVWRMYKVAKPSLLPVPEAYPFGDRPFVAPKLKSILPIKSKRSFAYEYKPAEVIGYFFDDKITSRNNAEPPDNFLDSTFDQDESESIEKNLFYQDSFSVDEARGIVSFGRPVYYKERTGDEISPVAYKPAKILLRTSFRVRQENGQFMRQVYTFWPGNQNVVPNLDHTHVADEIPYWVTPREQRNKQLFEFACQEVVKQESQKYFMDSSATVVCNIFRFDYWTDGRITAITYQRDESGAGTTTIEWQTEKPMSRLTYDEKLKNMRDKTQAFLQKSLINQMIRDQATKPAGGVQ